MYNYSQGYTVGGGMGNIGAYGGLIGGINNMMQGISPNQEEATPQNSMFGGPQMGQAVPGMNMFGMAGQIAQNPYQNLGLVGQVVGGFQGTATDMHIQAEEIVKLRNQMNKLYRKF